MTTKEKALALVNEACKSDFKDLGLTYRNNILDALLRAIEQHEAFRQEVSDMLQVMGFKPGDGRIVGKYIIAKPDPLEEVMEELVKYSRIIDAASIRAAMKARGYEYRKIERANQ